MNDPSVAASPNLPMGTKLLLHNKENGKMLIVVIGDRMPEGSWEKKIDLSMAGAEMLGFRELGSAILEAILIE